MAINIKTPNDIIPPKSSQKGGPGEYNGEPGYTKRTPSANGVPEKTYEKVDQSKVNIKTPGDTPRK